MNHKVNSVQNPFKSSSSASLLNNKSINRASSTGSRIAADVTCFVVTDVGCLRCIIVGATCNSCFSKTVFDGRNFYCFPSLRNPVADFGMGGLLHFPVSVKVWIPSDIHFSHSSQTWFLKELFTEMSDGCNFFVRLLGITAVVVL